MSYYELADELMIDEYGSNAVNNLKKEANWEAVRKKYRDSRSSYFKDIFGERYKNAKGKYDIPINDKELVKSAILGYTRLKYYKEIRKNRIPTIEHIQEYVSYMDKAIDRTSISSEEKEQLKSEFYTLHQIMSNKASAQAVENVSDLLKEKLVGIKNKKILKSTEVGIKEEISLRNLGAFL